MEEEAPAASSRADRRSLLFLGQARRSRAVAETVGRREARRSKTARAASMSDLPVPSEITQILEAVGRGEPHAAQALLPLVYEELRRLAARKLGREAPGQTLNATALVHEAYVRLVGRNPEQAWAGRGHFFAAAAESMRRILVENARRNADSDTVVTSCARTLTQT